MKWTIFTLLLVLCCASAAMGQPQNGDKRPVSDSDYNALLLQADVVASKTETALHSIDLSKLPDLPYSEGKGIEDQRNVALLEVNNIHQFVNQQRVKRTVYGELALHGFLDDLFASTQQIVWMTAIRGAGPNGLDANASKLGAITAALGNDAMKRVSLLD